VRCTLLSLATLTNRAIGIVIADNAKDNKMAATVWATAISKNQSNGRAIIFRFIKEFGENFDRITTPIRIIIAWSYDSETGMPPTDVREWMDSTEDALKLAVEKEHFANLVLVSTGENLREWTYYTRSESEFMDRLNVALASHPVAPISIHISEDSQWTMYDEFRCHVRE